MLFNEIVEKYTEEAAQDNASSKYKKQLDKLYKETNIKRKGIFGEQLAIEIFKEYFEDINKTNLNYELDLVSEKYKLRIEVKTYYDKKFIKQEYLKLYRDICNTASYFHIFINLYPDTIEPNIHYGLKLIYLDISHINDNVMKYIKNIIIKENENNEKMIKIGFRDHLKINYATRNDIVNKYIFDINQNIKNNIIKYIKNSNINVFNENTKKLNNFINTSLLKQRKERIMNYEYLLLSNIRPPNYANPNILNEIVKFIIINYNELTDKNNLMLYNKTTDCIEFSLISFQNYIYCGYIPNNVLRNIKDIFFIHSRNRSVRKNYSLLKYISPEEYNKKDESNISLYRIRTLEEIDNKYTKYKTLLETYLNTKSYNQEEKTNELNKYEILEYINNVLIENNIITDEEKIKPDIFMADDTVSDIIQNSSQETHDKDNDESIIDKNVKNPTIEKQTKEQVSDSEFVIEEIEPISSDFFENETKTEDNIKQTNIKQVNTQQTTKIINTITLNKDRIHINDNEYSIDYYELKKNTSKKNRNKYNIDFKENIVIDKNWLHVAEEFINNNYTLLLKPDFTITSEKIKQFALKVINENNYCLRYDGAIFKKVLTLYDVYEKRNDLLKPVYRIIYHKFVEEFSNYREENNKNNKINKNGIIQGFTNGYDFAKALDEYLNISNNILPQRDDKNDLIKYKEFYNKYKLKTTIKRVLERFTQVLNKNDRLDELVSIKSVLFSHGINTSLTNKEKEEAFKYHFMKCINDNIRFTDEEWFINYNQKTSVYNCVLNMFRDLKNRNCSTYSNCKELMEEYKDISKEKKLCYRIDDSGHIFECCYETIR